MARLRYDTIGKDAVGTDVNVPETIGSLTTNPEATDLVGLITNSAVTGRTAEDITAGKFIWKLGSLAFDDLEFQDGQADGGTGASNSDAIINDVKFVPFASVNPNVGNKKISVQYEQLVAGAPDVQAMASICYAEGSIPSDVLGNLYRLQTRVRWNATDTMEIENVGSKQFTNAMNIPNWVNELVAIGITVNLNDASDVDASFMGFLDFSSGGSLPNMTPCRVPLSTISEALGTPGGSALVSREVILPYYVKLPNADVTVKPSIVLTDESKLYNGKVHVTYTLYGR